MKNRSQNRCYIELFAGPGRCIVEGTKNEIPGSPLQAIDIRDRFTHYLFNDINPSSIEALERRVTALDGPPKPRYFTQDCNVVIPELRKALPPPDASLELAIIDAWGWEIDFDALASLTLGRRMDIVVTFPIGFMKRNWGKELRQLDRFLGGDGYRKAFVEAMGQDPRKASRILLDHFEGRLDDIGYRYSNDEIWIPNTRRVKLYQMVFASRHHRGSEFWQKIINRSPAGQYKFDLSLS